MSQKDTCTFKNVPVGQTFYMKRFPDGSETDSISFVKVDETHGYSIEWGNPVIHPDQPCWFFK